MYIINDQLFTEADYAFHCKQFERLPWLTKTNDQRIAVCLDDTARWLALCLYCKTHRIAVMPIHPTTPETHARQLAAKAHCNHLVFHNLEQPIQLMPDAALQHQPGLIQLSSGTTGDPKCIERSWQDIENEIRHYILCFTVAESMTPVVACPTTHSYGLICGVLVGLARGKTPHVITNINPKFLIKTLLRVPDHLLYSSPAQLDALLRLWPKSERLNGVMTSGSVMTQATFDRMSPYINHLFQQYGCSETGCLTINQNVTKPSALGSPLSHVVVQAGLSQSSPAEIVVKSACPIHGQTSTTQTHDLGYFETLEDGSRQLYFVARQDDTILVAGLNVYPIDVETKVLEHPEIIDAVAFKVPDPLAGERVGLQFVGKPGLSSESVQSWCAHHLPSHQVPQAILAVNEIARLPNGKINRRNLTATLQQATKQNPKGECQYG